MRTRLDCGSPLFGVFSLNHLSDRPRDMPTYRRQLGGQLRLKLPVKPQKYFFISFSSSFLVDDAF